MIRHSTTPHQNTSTKEGFDRKSNEVLTGSIARNECARRCSIDRNQAFDRSSNQSINRSIDRSAIAGSDLRAIDRSVGACCLFVLLSRRALAALHLPHHRLLHISLARSCALLFVSLSCSSVRASFSVLTPWYGACESTHIVAWSWRANLALLLGAWCLSLDRSYTR